jgi:hypothetical protein
MRKFCEALLEVAWDDVKSTEIFEKAVALVKAAANGNFHRDNIRTELFTKLVVEEVGLRHGGAGSTALRRARP